MSPAWPPLDGSVPVLPGFIDFQAVHNPTLPYAIFPTEESSSTTTSVSFLEYARATHRIAHALRPGRAGIEGEVVVVLIHCDTLLYLATLAGMVRAGLVPFPMSPRNSPEAVVNMIEKTGCHRIITQPALAPLTAAVQSALVAKGFALQIDELPSLQAVFPKLGNEKPEDSFELGLYPGSGKPHSMDDIVLYLHSSGSTGFPKPIPQRQKTVLHWCHFPLLVKARDAHVRWGSMALPTFHTMGVYMQLYAPLVSSQPISIFTPKAPGAPVMPNPQNSLHVAKVTSCTGIPSVPAFIEAWSHSEENVKYLQGLQVLAYAGGPLSDTNGNKLAAAGVKLAAIYGGTEFGGPTGLFDTDDSHGLDADVKTSADWAWMQFSDLNKCRWVPQGDGTYELHFLTCDTHQLAVENLPDTKGYATADLWLPHPKKKGLWKIVGRLDDVIVLGTGEKVVPIPQEGHIGSNPIVAGAVMFGRGKNQVGILIEPAPQHAFDPQDQEALIAFRNKIWPSVDEANKPAPAFGRIFKEMIIVTDPKKPMPRAGKGTVMRKMTLAIYADAIEALYTTVEASADASGVAPPKSWAAADLELWLGDHAASINKGQKPSTSVDIFEQGFDSLSATYLRNRIIGALRSSGDPAAQAAAGNVDQNVIFANPTLQQLARAIAALVDPTSDSGSHKSPSEAITEIISKYALPASVTGSGSSASPSSGIVVLLTGATGSLGAHILAYLLGEPYVARVYALNRAAKAEVGDRLRATFVDQGLPVDPLASEKLTVLVGDLGRDDFGLEPSTLAEIKRTTTHVIHNAWKVDFNQALSSFESYVASSRRLLDLAVSAAHQPRFIFTSSIAGSQGWDYAKGPVPESVLPDPQVAVSTGYGSSKYAVEQILARAAQQGFQTLTLRIGQICGSTVSGAWNPTEWVPILIKSSVALQCTPDLHGAVSWIPMDAVGRAVVDVVLRTGPLPELINVVHPRMGTWRAVLSAVNDALGLGLPLVPVETWLAKLEALSSQPSASDLETVPAIKLLDIYRGTAAADKLAQSGACEAGGSPFFATAKATEVSQTLRELSPIGKTDAALWVKYWRDKNFIAAPSPSKL